MKSVEYAKQKVKAVITAVDSIRELDFPYDDPRAAIEYICNEFRKQLEHLEQVSDLASARVMCKQISKDIDNFLLAIGFMVRACDVDGALELQGPLRRLTHRAISKDVKLVISSEWRFSPFTLLYPGEFGNSFVLVGLPASEAGNPLIAPLAGHELGHNVWNRLPDLEAFIGKKIKEKVIAVIKGELWDRFSKTFAITGKEQVDQEELFETIAPWQVAKTWGVLQSEEMFCDFFGLCIFGEGYLHAFQYLISPGGGLRNPTYPSMRDRISALLQAAKDYGVQAPVDFAKEFDDSEISADPRQQLLLLVSDMASKAAVPYLIEAAKSLCEKQKLITRDAKDIERIVACYRDAIPATNALGLANIINAAWQIFLDSKNPWATNYPITEKQPEKRVELIRELALKSFEVFEIERLQE